MGEPPKEYKEIVEAIIKANSLVLENKVNNTDIDIIKKIYEKQHSIGELSKALNLAPVNLWKHLKKLKKLKIINIPQTKKGVKKYPEVIKDDPLVKTIISDKDWLNKFNIK